MVQMEKVQIVGLKEQREQLIQQLQKLELIHLKNFEEETVEEHFVPTSTESEERKFLEEMSHIESAINYLNEFKEGRGVITSFISAREVIGREEFERIIHSFKYRETIEEIQKIRQEIASIEEEISKLKSEIAYLLPWRNLQVPPSQIKETDTTDSLFIRGPKEKQYDLKEKSERIGEVFIEVISLSADSVYALAIYWKEKEREIRELLKEEDFEEVELFSYHNKPSEIIDSHEKKVGSLQKRKETLNEKAKEMLNHRRELMILYDWYLSSLTRERAKRNVRESQTAFVLQGWIRKSDRGKMEKFLKDKFPASYVRSISPQAGENPPVEVRNPQVIRPFQAVTTLFGLPRYGEVDPSFLIAPFFFLFFGLCLTDAGYGIVLVILSLLALKRITVEEEGKRFFHLFSLCGGAAILWGMLTGGWFGIEVERLPAFLRGPILFNPLEDLMFFFLLALSFGFIQVLFGLGIEMYEQLREKNFASAFADQFSYIIILPGALLWVVAREGILNRVFIYTGSSLIFLGFGVLVVGSLLKRGRNPLMGLVSGLGGLLWKAKDFLGNILSYSRLMALGLATGVIAFVINTIANIASDIPYLGVAVALLILVGGHFFNIAVNTLGGFVHTTRLQFVEFFSYFFQGGGEAFEPLAEEGKYVITTEKGGTSWK